MERKTYVTSLLNSQLAADADATPISWRLIKLRPRPRGERFFRV
jgi:hypothetical protein